MSYDLCKWFKKSGKNQKAKKIEPEIPKLSLENIPLSDTAKIEAPVPKPRPLSTFSPQKTTIPVFTDGSTINNGKRVEIVRGGVGVFFGKNDGRNISKKVIAKKVTNNVCELMACILAIETVINTHESMNFIEIMIYSDSEYIINSIVKWADGWEKNDYCKRVKGKLIPVKNQIYIKKLHEYYKKYNIKFQHVRAHKSAPDASKQPEKYKLWYGNYMADQLAKCAAIN